MPFGKYQRTPENTAWMREPWTCPKCGKESRKLGSGSHLKWCGRSEERFWERVAKQESGCWIFQGCTDKWGYAHYGVQHRRVQAHRYAFTITKGPIPAGKLVMHSCDVPACVNPDHLSLGTDLENHRDCMAKGRHPYGERTLSNKLTSDQVRKIRVEYKAVHKRKTNAKELAAKYGVSPGAITGIIAGRTWANLK